MGGGLLVSRLTDPKFRRIQSQVSITADTAQSGGMRPRPYCPPVLRAGAVFLFRRMSLHLGIRPRDLLPQIGVCGSTKAEAR